MDTSARTASELTVQDVLQVKTILRQVSSSTGGLPIELIDIILDFAEYWPHTSSTCQMRDRDTYGHSNLPADKLICRSLPLGCLSNSGLLSPNSNYPTQSPHAAAAPDPKSSIDWVESLHESIGNSSGLPPSPNDKRNALLNAWSTHSSPRTANPCRKIVFTITSHDQGWGGERSHRGTYDGSYTWFDVGLERIEPFPGEFVDLPLVGKVYAPYAGTENYNGKDDTYEYALRTMLPPAVPSEVNSSIYKFSHPICTVPPTCLQRNLTATSESKTHIITWSWDDNIDPQSDDAKALEKIGRGGESATGEFVRGLSIGDVITVWSRSRFSGWKNVAESVKIDVYWAV